MSTLSGNKRDTCKYTNETLYT